MRFYLDEHIPSALTDGLRRRGVDVLTVQEAGRRGDSDEEQLAFALRESLVLVTFDDDYLVLDARSVSHAGIVDAPDLRRALGQLIDSIQLIDGAMSPAEMQNHVEFI